MVYENEYAGQPLPYYQFQQPMQSPAYFNDPYPYHAQYYDPNMYGSYMPPMNSGYMPPYANGGYTPAYMNEANYGPQAAAYYEEPSVEGFQANRVMQQFLDENGQVNIQKMLQTVGQFADTVQQVSPVIKQLNDLVRSFRA